MITFLHTADWQIGKTFGQFEADEAALLAEARFDTVARIAALASHEACALVLVAGDVFDAQTVADRVIHRLFEAMRAYTGPWVLIPGNHDAALVESVWTRARRLGALPPNVLLCERPEPLLLHESRVALLPAPLTQRHVHEDLSAWFDHADTPPGYLRIGLAHGSVSGILPEDIDSPNPIDPGRAQHARLDYFALGDWHGTRAIDARTWYSGTPEPDRFRANDAGQVLRVRLVGEGAVPEVEAIPVGRHRWRDERHVLQVPTDLEALIGRLAAVEARDVCHWRIGGDTDLAGHRLLTAALERARGKARALLADLSALAVRATGADIDALAVDGYLAGVVETLRQAQVGPEAPLAREALLILAGLLDERGEGRAAP